MEHLLLYLLKSATLLSTFLLVYQLLLKKDTSFKANRHFLFLGILTAALLPAMEFTRTVQIESPSHLTDILLPSEETQASPTLTQETDWWQILGAVYIIGLALMLIRFLLQLFSIHNLIRNQPERKVEGFNMISSNKELAPFSFFRTIVFNPSLHSPEELNSILEHEKVHANQWHSVDVLLSHLVTAVLWFNPPSWWYRKSMLQNLEFLADKEAVASSVSKTSYQHTLLKIAVADFQPAMATNFNQSFIKRRIMMLNKKPSHEKTLWKMGVSLPLIIAFVICFQVRTEAQAAASLSPENDQIITDITLSSTITKETKDESLEQLENLFENQGIELDFKTVRRSREGYITKIKISHENSNTTRKGTFSRANSEGIDPFSITLEEGKLVFTETAATPETTQSHSLFSKIGTAPLFVINEKEYESSDLHGKSVQIQSGFSLFSGEEAAGKHGTKAKDGVILISEGIILDDLETTLKNIDNQENTINRHFVSIEKGKKPSFISVEKTASNTESSIQVSASKRLASKVTKSNNSSNTDKETKAFAQDSLPPLIIVDGKIMDKTFDVNTIAPEDIATVDVKKGDMATGVYGEKAENGVIEIRLKSGKNTPEDANTLESEKKKSKTLRIKSSKGDTNIITVEEDSATSPTSSTPLYVINGKVMELGYNTKEIDPHNIISIDVIKGPRAIELYGDKAKNGVVLISIRD